MTLHFGRHETFHLRTGWLNACYSQTCANSKFLSQKGAPSLLGVGKNMVNAIRYWGQAFQIINPVNPRSKKDGFLPSDLAHVIFKNDPYLEDPGSDWLLHYHLVNNLEYAPSFYWLFQKLGGRVVTKAKFIEGIESFIRREYPEKALPSVKVLERDFSVFVRTYCGRAYEDERKASGDVLDSPFTHLGLANRNDSVGGGVTFAFGPKFDLPSEIVAYALFMMQVGNDNLKPTTLNIDLDRVLWDPGSPGTSFKLDGDSLIKHLEVIRQKELIGQVKFDSTAGMQKLTITLPDRISPLNILEKYYEGSQ